MARHGFYDPIVEMIGLNQHFSGIRDRAMSQQTERTFDVERQELSPQSRTLRSHAGLLRRLKARGVESSVRLPKRSTSGSTPAPDLLGADIA